MPPVTSARIPLRQAFGQRGGVVDDPGGIVGERRLACFGEGHRLGRHDMRERATQHHRTAPIHELGVLGRAQDESTARSAQ